MTWYRIFRPRNPVQQQQQQQQQHDHRRESRRGKAKEEVPGLQLVRSEDSSDCNSTFPGEQLNPTDDSPYCQPTATSKWTTLDVHACKSITCDCCRRPMPPTFLTVPVVPADTIRCLPGRWWEKNYDETNATKLLSAAIDDYKTKFPVVDAQDADAPYDEAKYWYYMVSTS
jgi:hypothetical protein